MQSLAPLPRSDGPKNEALSPVTPIAAANYARGSRRSAPSDQAMLCHVSPRSAMRNRGCGRLRVRGLVDAAHPSSNRTVASLCPFNSFHFFLCPSVALSFPSSPHQPPSSSFFPPPRLVLVPSYVPLERTEVDSIAFFRRARQSAGLAPCRLKSVRLCACPFCIRTRVRPHWRQG
jgi:hypothetical protein